MPIVRDGQLNRLADIVAPADVTDDGFHCPSRLPNRVGGLAEHVRLVVEHDHPRALGRESTGHGTTDALGGSGDDNTLAFESLRGCVHEIKPPWPGPLGMTGQISTTRSPS